ncbi:hypothetical protein C5S53_09360 [Methanophagales archaeon]|nr:hypothetical protein C5S53_09360 [Methanophagales archaeon]
MRKEVRKGKMKKRIIAFVAIAVIMLVGIAVCSTVEQPADKPAASTGKTASGVDVSILPKSPGMTPTSASKIVLIGSPPPQAVDWLDMSLGSQLWTLYNGVWTQGSAAIYVGDWTYLLLYNDHNQWISIYEVEPSGWKDWNPLGHQKAGYYYHQFDAEKLGWYRVYAHGSSTGDSNTVWIYVWPKTQPQPPLTVNAWMGSSYYTIYPPSIEYTYYSVSKPCTARVTYLKQGGSMARYGPRAINAGTHTASGTVGQPIGMRTVVVDAWTSSGEYAYDITSYNVG